MAKRRMAVITVLLCLCLSFLPCYVRAVSTTDASEPINVNEDCSLTLSYICEKTVFESVSVSLYKIADVSSDFQYTLIDKFAPTDLILKGIKTDSEWKTIRSTIEYPLARHLNFRR